MKGEPGNGPTAAAGRVPVAACPNVLRGGAHPSTLQKIL